MEQALMNFLRKPHLRLHGEVADSWIDAFMGAADKVEDGDLFVVEATTTGGDAEVGRRLALEARLLRARGVRLAFLGKTVVYSAGVTFMAGFRQDERWLTPDCWLLIHGRQMTKDICLDGPLQACKDQLTKTLTEIEAGFALEREGFDMLAQGSTLGGGEVAERATHNWYLAAPEAKALGLVAGLFEG